MKNNGITFGQHNVNRNPVIVHDIKANLFIGDAGEMVDSFEITVDDISKVSDLVAEDFEITGNHDGFPLNGDEEIVQENFEDNGIALTLEGHTIFMEVNDFKYPGGLRVEFEVSSTKYPELSFTKEDLGSVSTRTVDDFEKETFTGSNGVTIPYRLHIADTGNSEPLVIWMHGAGQVGKDNITPITANRGAVAFAESNHTTNVIAAQYPYVYSEELTDAELDDMTAFFKAYKELIETLIEEGKVDPNRIYLAGASMGGGLTLQFMLEEPELFAAVVSIASRGTIKDLDRLKSVTDLPIWLFHAEEDPTNVSQTSKNIYNKLLSLGSGHADITIYSTEYMHTLKLFGGLLHCSWVPALNDDEMMDWLFSH